MPGNRAVAAGRGVRLRPACRSTPSPTARAPGSARSCWWRWPCCRSSARTPASPRTMCCTCSRAPTLAGIDLRASAARRSGYDQDTPLLFGDFVTTEAGTGFVHIAPGHGEDDFDLGRRHGLDDPRDGRRRRHLQRLGAAVRRRACLQGGRSGLRRAGRGRHAAGAGQAGALLPAFLALQGAADLPRHAAMVHPPGWAGAHPREGARGDRRDAVRAGPGPQPHRLDGGRPARTGASAASAPGACRSPCSSKSAPASRCAIRRWCSASSRPSTAEGADAWYASPPSRFLGNDRNPDDYEQVMDIVDVWFESGSTHAFVLEGRDLPWPADLYLEGSDQHRGWFQSSLLEAVGTRGRAPFKAVLTDGFVMDEHGPQDVEVAGQRRRAGSRSPKQYGVDILRLWVMMSDTSEDLRIGPEILKQQAELYRRLRNTLRWVLGSLAGFDEAERVPLAEMPELERWVLHRLTELDARIRSSGGELRLDRRVSRAAQFLRHRPVGVLFRHPQGRALLRPAGQPAPPRRSDGAGPSAPLPDHLAGAGAVLHRRGSLGRPLRRRRERASATVPDPAARLARRRAGGEMGDDPQPSAAASPCRSRKPARPRRWAPRCRPRSTLPLAPGRGGTADRRRNGQEIAIVSSVHAGRRQRRRARPTVTPAPGTKCVRCWRVLPEVGSRRSAPVAVPALRRRGGLRPGVQGRPREPRTAATCRLV